MYLLLCLVRENILVNHDHIDGTWLSLTEKFTILLDYSKVLSCRIIDLPLILFRRHLNIEKFDDLIFGLVHRLELEIEFRCRENPDYLIDINLIFGRDSDNLIIILWLDNKRINNRQVYLGSCNIFVPWLQNFDFEGSVAWFNGLENKIVALLSHIEMTVAVSLHVRVFHGNPPDILRPRNYVPVKSEAVEGTENISFLVEGSDGQMLAISSAELPES